MWVSDGEEKEDRVRSNDVGREIVHPFNLDHPLCPPPYA